MKEINSPNDTQTKLEPQAGQGYNGKATKAYETYLSILDDVDQAIKSGMSARDYAISKGVPSSLTDEVADLLDKYNFRMDADPDNQTMSPDELAKAVDDWNGGSGTEGAGDANIKAFHEGNKSFNEVLDDYAKTYANKVNSNEDWSWNKSFEGGEQLSIKQKKLIKEQAVNNGYIPDVKVIKADGMRYGFADFNSTGIVRKTAYLPENMWRLSDAEQFEWLDSRIGGHVDGYTWHHNKIPGKMELVPTGIHNITTHNGGRTTGMWADAPR